MGLTETAAALCHDCFYCCYYEYADGHAWGDFRCVYICFEICVDHGHAWGDFRSDFYFTACDDHGHDWGDFRQFECRCIEQHVYGGTAADVYAG